MAIDKVLLEKLYVTDKLSTREIGHMLVVGKSTVSRQLVKHGIERRPCSMPGPDSHRWNGGVIMNQGHVMVFARGHHRANGEGYVQRSILVWEETNGMPFPEGKEPHHKNLVKDDDRPDNIEPKTHSAHARLHAILRHKTEAKHGKG